MRRLIDCRGRRGRGDDFNLCSSSRMAHGGAHHGFFTHIILQHSMLFIYHVGGVGKAAVALATMDHGAGELRTCYAPNIDAMAHVSLERIPRTLYQQQKPTIFIYY